MSQTAKVLLLYAHPESQDSVANRVLLKPALQLQRHRARSLRALS
jgi:glutathione-regulated potassium-efflux system ancillary protein KefG